MLLITLSWLELASKKWLVRISILLQTNLI